MVNSFLYKVAEDVYARQGMLLGNAVVVFPNRRPIGFFKSALAELVDVPLPSPTVISIEDLVWNISGMNQAQELELIFDLYNIYIVHRPEESFDKFYSWGKLLLSDFDEIDRYLVNTKKLFSNLKAVKELENEFMKVPDDFWDSINSGSATNLQQQFISQWDIFGKVYDEFTRFLAANRKAYPGLAYREAERRIRNDQNDASGIHYYFAGFNALSAAEMSIMKALLKKGKAEFYWDIDKYYLDNTREEAGHFIRKSLKELPLQNKQTVTDRLRNDTININIIGVPLSVGQAKALGVELKKFTEVQEVHGETAIVMPDDGLLLPLLYSLPEAIPHFYVTGGYPLKDTLVNGLFEKIIELQQNYNDQSQGFYFKDVSALLTHPLYRSLAGDAPTEFLALLEKGQQIFILKELLISRVEMSPLNRLFQKPGSTEQFAAYIKENFEHLSQGISELNDREAAALRYLEDIFSNLTGLIKSGSTDVTIPAFVRMMREMIAHSRLPISEEQSDTLQIMGMLETRCLQFENVFILSVNEGILPAHNGGHSYIPFDLRKAYGLPTPEEHDSLYAYYFYRLIHGAENVYLFYNSETGKDGTEKSRYIRQIENFLVSQNSRLKVTYRNYSLPLTHIKAQEIIVEKDRNYFNKLIHKNANAGFSPSFVTNYFVCSLKFLLQSILKLKPLEEVSEDVEGAVFGNLFHDLMYDLYAPWEGKEIDFQSFAGIRSKISSALDNLMNKNHSGEHLKSRNSLQIETIKVLAEKTIELDQNDAPFTILGLEKDVEHTLKNVEGALSEIKLKGRIDRIDDKAGAIRIVDYKTG
ncbi:MAG: PD-(D/E)XK nuclease family protein, partial [Bacteroidota bacterium]|nr:PD-(D/E)XK nuclease family protein [Bacteroidota bacterium]